MTMRKATLGIGLLALLGVLYSLVPWGCEESHSPTGPRHPACWKPLVIIDEYQDLIAESAPAWSHSEELIAFSSDYDSCNDPFKSFYISAPDGRSRRPLYLNGTVIRWLPGDSEVIVNTGFFFDGELVELNLNTNQVAPLGITTNSLQFDISSNGRFLYYENDGLIEYDLFAGTSRSLGVRGGDPAVSPDGRWLLYSAGNIHLYDLLLQRDSTTAHYGYYASWSPDGKTIYYASGTGFTIRMFTLDGDSAVLGSGTRPISVGRKTGRILYRNTGSDGFSHLWIMNADGKHQRQLTE